MNVKTTQTINVCLNFGGAYCTYIETDDDHIDEEVDVNSWFTALGFSDDALCSWAAENLDVIFDGDLDNPENFKSIKAIGAYGPKMVEIENGLPLISGFSLYFEVEAESDLSEDDLEDMFHLVIPVIQNKNEVAAFTEFDDYSVFLEAPSEGARPIEVVWPDVE